MYIGLIILYSIVFVIESFFIDLIWPSGNNLMVTFISFIIIVCLTLPKILKMNEENKKKEDVK